MRGEAWWRACVRECRKRGWCAVAVVKAVWETRGAVTEPVCEPCGVAERRVGPRVRQSGIQR